MEHESLGEGAKKEIRDWITPGFVYCMGRPVSSPSGIILPKGTHPMYGLCHLSRTLKRHICLLLAGSFSLAWLSLLFFSELNYILLNNIFYRQ